ncbi:hypothetical protein BSKO_07618 [Bryopsis sp. KO-2023]|nr:hypothetical protein BSKO_07618 [Bryopsis sp. KO-2023]
MSATFMFAGAGFAAALGAAIFATKDLSAELRAIATRPIFPENATLSDGRRVELCASIALDGLHPFENFELKEVAPPRH